MKNWLRDNAKRMLLISLVLMIVSMIATNIIQTNGGKNDLLRKYFRTYFEREAFYSGERHGRNSCTDSGIRTWLV